MKYYERQFKVGYPEIDALKRLKLAKLIDFCTTIYYQFGETVGIDEQYLINVGGNWIVDEMQGSFEHYPLYHETIWVRGSVSSYNRFFVYWTFDVLDEQKQAIGKLELAMSLLDLTTRKLIAIPEELGDAFEAEKNNQIKRFPKTDLTGLPAEPVADVIPRFSQLDYNGHVFNGHYYEWLLDSLPSQFLEKHTLQSITVRFEEEIKLAEPVQLFLQCDDLTSVHAIKGKAIKAVATIHWQAN